jgi:PAS domain S-box-containing protein
MADDSQALRSLRAILDATPFPVALVDTNDDVIEFWSRSALTLFGHTASTTAEWYELAYPDPAYRQEVIERWKPCLEEARRSGRPVNTGEYQVACRDGSVRTCELYATFLADGLVVTFNDVTERKQAETALRESEEKFKYIFDYSPIGKSITLPTGEIHVNRAFCQMLGYSREELEHERWQDITVPDDVAETQRHMEALIAGDAGEVRFVKRYLRKDGSIVWADVASSLRRDGSGEPVYFVTAMVDITERVRAERALAEAKDLLVEAEEIGHSGGWQYDVAADRVTWTDQVFEIYGVDRDFDPNDVGRDIEFYAPGSAPLVADAFQRAVTSAEPYDLEVELDRADGALIWVRTVGRPVVEDGAVVRVIGNIIDITQRKRAEEQLRESEEDFRTLAEVVPQIVWMTDPEGKNTYFNQQWVDYTGMTLEESYGDGWNTPFHPDDRQPAWDAWQRATQDDVPYALECRLRRADGAYRWWLIRGAPLRDESGTILKWFGTCTDIEEIKQTEHDLQQSQALLQAAMDRSQAGIAIADAPDGRLRYVNQAGLFIRGGSEAEVVDQVDAARYVESWHILHHDGTAYADDEVPLARAVLHGETSEAEFIIRRDDHEDRVVLARAAPIRDEEGMVTAGVVVFHDITERKQAEEEVRRLNRELEQRVVSRTAQLEAANRELESFAYSVSHDLRAPLRAIDGFTQMVIEDAGERLEAADLEHLGRARGAAQRMASLIDDLLVLSRASRTDLVRRGVDLSALAEEVAAELREAEPERSVDLAVMPGMEVTADPTLLRVIVSNLLGNAWKFTSRHETARIEVGETDAAGERAFFVRDDGAGFDLAKARHLFGAFQRFHAPEEFDGSGIGLATVQRLVARHGGRLWAEAEVEKGATFSFTLPEPAAGG